MMSGAERSEKVPEACHVSALEMQLGSVGLLCGRRLYNKGATATAS